MAIKAAEKSLSYRCLIDPDVPSHLRGDPGRIRQVLINLIGNAVKFTSDGGITLEVSCKSSDERQARIGFVITDTGIGIPEDQTERLFEKFTQLDMSTSRKYGGTGLGLAISRQLCEMMGGEIHVVSEVGKGSSFHLTVLLDRQQAAEAAADTELREPHSQSMENASPVEPRPEGLAFEPPTEAAGNRLQTTAAAADGAILLVEDNETIQLVSMGLLKSLGYTADLAVNGQEAVDALKRKAYALVLMDMEMPVLDGYSATRIIRGKNSPVLNPDIPIIAMTAHAMQRDLDRCMEAGMNGYLTKPVKKQDLAAVIERFVASAPATADAAAAPENAGAGADDGSIFDEAGIRERLDGSDELIQVVMQSFVDSFPERINELILAYESRDEEQIRALGHNIKGSSSTAGATALMKTAVDVEDAGRNGDFQMIPDCIDRLKSDFDKLKKILTNNGIL
jgi:CheY-like chemotaxis protein/HPt (histidine-containing phosphotransfer) domain-containing protein